LITQLHDIKRLVADLAQEKAGHMSKAQLKKIITEFGRPPVQPLSSCSTRSGRRSRARNVKGPEAIAQEQDASSTTPTDVPNSARAARPEGDSSAVRFRNPGTVVTTARIL
jgi:hypothetical protein